jgi:hypothetical protein
MFDEFRIILLKKLLTDSMLFEPCPLDTVTSTLKATFQTTGKPPYNRLYRISSTGRIIIRQLIDEMIRQKHIQVSNSPYASPVHIVKKKDEGHRLVCDFRLVNKIMKAFLLSDPSGVTQMREESECFALFIHFRNLRRIILLLRIRLKQLCLE